jgi:Transposase, Mutator family
MTPRVSCRVLKSPSHLSPCRGLSIRPRSSVRPSTGDFEEALAALLGNDAGGLSTSTVARLKDAWVDEHVRWSKRDLTAKRYVYFWVDGIHVQARLEDDPQCLLVIVGATPEGKKEFVGLADGVRESTQSWKEMLLDLRRRGLTIGPEFAVADGALGFWKALDEVWPKTRGQIPGRVASEFAVARVRSASHDVASPWPPSQSFSRPSDEAHRQPPAGSTFALGDEQAQQRGRVGNADLDGAARAAFCLHHKSGYPAGS